MSVFRFNRNFAHAHLPPSLPPPRRLVLSIRGSLELGDIGTDLAAQLQPWSLGGRPACVHKGLLSAAHFVMASVKEELVEATGMFPGWPLLITGAGWCSGVRCTERVEDAVGVRPNKGLLAVLLPIDSAYHCSIDSPIDAWPLS